MTKIRHRQSGVEIEGAWQVHEMFFFIPGQVTAYHRSEWELITPEPVWRDVTAECEVTEDGLRHIVSDTESVPLTGIGAECMPESYRLTKISGPLTPHVAFIVEMQE